MLKIYNSLTQKKEIFVPVKEGKVGIYGCGVTPYKPSHLGHAMQGIIFDVIRRYLEYKGYQVTYVRNYTDIEDRIIERAKDAKMDTLTYSQMIIDQCDKDFDMLRVRRADYTPKVTEFIDEIIQGVQRLIDLGYAYSTEKGNVYYSIAKFPDYGKLSKQKLSNMLNGVRKDIEPDKKDVMDFALWKASKEGEIFWESPWGKGRPGWHIECSIMSTHYLGDHFDIHGGGSDLLFPHHENEIAQSEAMHGGHFVNYWIHNGLLMVGDKKMSKSLNNDVSIQDWLKKYHPEIIRYLILTNHYRSHVQFVPSRYAEATKKVYQAYKTINRLKNFVADTKKSSANTDDYISKFESSMDNDFNTVQVIADINEVLVSVNEELSRKPPDLSKLVAILKYINIAGGILGIFDLDPNRIVKEIEDQYLNSNDLTREYIEAELQKRLHFRISKDYAQADQIRSELLTKGITVLDTNDSTSWELLV